MRNLIITAAMCCLALGSHAQVKKTTEESPKSKLELFSERSGSMIKKDFTDLAKIKSVEFQILKLTDLTSSATVAGLRLSGRGSGTYGSTHTAFLDADEVDAYLKAINYLITNIINTTPPANDVEYNFQSRSGLTSGAYNYKGKWFCYVKLEKYSSDSQFEFNTEDLVKVKEAVEQVKAKL